MPDSVQTSIGRFAIDEGFDVSSEAKGRPPETTGSIQAFGTDHAVPFAYSFSASSSSSLLISSVIFASSSAIGSSDARADSFFRASFQLASRSAECTDMLDRILKNKDHTPPQELEIEQ